jgi:hypothetical protein
MSNWSSTWKTIPPLVEKMLNASLHKSIVHRHLRWGCNIQSGQSCFDLGYSNYNLTRITWGLGCNFRCGGDGDSGAITIPTDARCSLHWVFLREFCDELKWRSSSTRRIYSNLAKSKIRKEIFTTSLYIISGHLLRTIYRTPATFLFFHQIMAIENLKKHLILALFNF